MDKKVVFNFFDRYKTTFALCEYFSLPINSVESYLVKRKLDEKTYPDFIKEFSIPAHKIDTANAFITAKHITTFNDGGVSIKKYGLLNLKDALELETPIKQFLRENGIAFDINNQQIMVNGNKFPLRRRNDVSPSKYDEAIDKLHIKLYHDKCETEVFLSGEDNELNRYPFIREHPEILNNIDSLLKTLQQPLNLGNKWTQLQNGKYYILEFDINIADLEFINNKPNSCDEFEEYLDFFGYTPVQFELDLIPKRLYSNIFLIQNSLDVFFSGAGKDFGQIFPETVIPHEIIRILEKQIE